MIFDIKTLAEINLSMQLLLTVALIYAVHFAKNKEFVKHCAIIRMAFLVQILAVLALMLPSMNGYLAHSSPGSFFRPEILMHHSLGILAVILWIYINLAFLKHIQIRPSIRTVMKLALGRWIMSAVIGFHIFVQVYL